MTTTLTTPAAPTHATQTTATAAGQVARAGRRSRWPILGVVGGVTGFLASMFGLQDLTEEQYSAGVSVIDHLDRARFHASFLLGIASVFALFVTASAWRRWAEQRAPRDVAARTIGSALSAVATVNIIFACLAGSMALYLPGGTDNGWLSRDAMFVNFTLLDFGQLLGWWGGMVAAGCVASLALRRQRVLPRWMGVFSIIAMLPPLAMAAAMALPGFVGFTMPIWLVVISTGMVFSRKANA
jgi:hypothetical protein